MILTAHQPAYHPWLGLIEKVARADVFVILDAVQFEKGSFINRQKIVGPNGPHWLTIPVHTKGVTEGTPIHDVRIDNGRNWRRKHMRSIEMAYRRAKYWDRYEPWLREFYSLEFETIDQPALDSLVYVLEEFGLDTDDSRAFHFLRTMRESNAYDFERDDGPKLTGVDCIVALCRTLEAESFLFGGLGNNYVDALFEQRFGIRPLFQEFNPPIYSQAWGGFTPNVWAMDLLLNHGPEASRRILNEQHRTDGSSATP